MAASIKNKLWAEKYRPSNIDNYIFNSPIHKKTIENFLKEQSIPHLLFAGLPGTGKTTLARIIIQELGMDELDVLTINASDERGIDTFREKVKTFSSLYSIGEFKIIHMEEADAITPSAQQALKSFMEEQSDYLRFIFTCNNINKLIPPIRSRCQEFIFKPMSRDEVTEYLAKILIKEKVKCTLDDLDSFVLSGYPDIRKILNNLQKHVVGNKIISPSNENTNDYRDKLVKLLKNEKWNSIRGMVADNISIEEYPEMYRIIFDTLPSIPKFSDEHKLGFAIVTVAKYLYQNTMVADPEICFAACIAELNYI